MVIGLLLLGQVPGALAALGIGFVVAAGVGAERTGAREVDPPTGRPSIGLPQAPSPTGLDQQTDLADISDRAVCIGTSRG
jgi:inner membrane transporter RhtA